MHVKAGVNYYGVLATLFDISLSSRRSPDYWSPGSEETVLHRTCKAESG